MAEAALKVVESEPVKLWKPRRLDIACGARKEPGWMGLDIDASNGAEIVHDAFDTPWPIKAGSVKEARCQHFVEHIPHYLPQFGGVDGWFVFWDEVYRIMAPGGTVEVTHPYVRSDRAFWDPTHVRYIHEATWAYLDKSWREREGLSHYPAHHDFEVVVANAIGVPDDFMLRSDEQQKFAAMHYWNPFPDLVVKLKRR